MRQSRVALGTTKGTNMTHRDIKDVAAILAGFAATSPAGTAIYRISAPITVTGERTIFGQTSTRTWIVEPGDVAVAPDSETAESRAIREHGKLLGVITEEMAEDGAAHAAATQDGC